MAVPAPNFSGSMSYHMVNNVRVFCSLEKMKCDLIETCMNLRNIDMVNVKLIPLKEEN